MLTLIFVRPFFSSSTPRQSERARALASCQKISPSLTHWRGWWRRIWKIQFQGLLWSPGGGCRNREKEIITARDGWLTSPSPTRSTVFSSLVDHRTNLSGVSMTIFCVFGWRLTGFGVLLELISLNGKYRSTCQFVIRRGMCVCPWNMGVFFLLFESDLLSFWDTQMSEYFLNTIILTILQI